MPFIIDETGQRINPNATTRLIRDDYRRKPVLTVAEAADWAGVTIPTVKDWMYKTKRFPMVARVGPYRMRTTLASSSFPVFPVCE